MDKQLSVVVACHDVEEFLPACLDSLAAQSLPPSQVVLVDDGSTDGTGRVCQEYAGRFPGWIVVQGPGSGPGGARNIGLAAVTGDYLAFVDGDDVVPPDAYRILIQTMDQTGSDFALGDVRRYDGVNLRPSGPHRSAVVGTKLRTNIRRTAGLMYDTTSWNKVFRMSFWRSNDLAFRPHVSYEDLPVMIAAHLAAESVDIIKQPVYWWRRRVDADASITQRRGEVSNLRDRLDAIEAVQALVVDDELLKRRHDRKVLTFDVPLYIPFFEQADQDYRSLFLQRVGAFVQQADQRVMSALSPRERLRYWLIEKGRADDLMVLLDSDRDPRGVRTNLVRDGKTLSVMPFLDEPGYPPELFVWGASHPVATGVDDLSWRGSQLKVTGFAHLVGIDDGGRRDRSVSVEWSGEKSSATSRVRTVKRPDLTASENAYDADYDHSGLTFTVDVAEFADDDLVRCDVAVTAPGGRRKVALSGAFDGRAAMPARRTLPDGRIALVRWRDEALNVLVQRPGVVITGLRLDASGVLHLEVDSRADGAVLIGSRRDSVREHEFPVASRMAIPLDTFAGDSGTKQVDIDFTVFEGQRSVPARLAPGVQEVLTDADGGEYWARANVAGGLLVSIRAARPRILQWWLLADDLVIEGDRGGSLGSLNLEHRSGQRYTYPVEVVGDRWTARLPLDDRGPSTGVIHLLGGRWNLLTDDDVPLHVADSLRWQTHPDSYVTAAGVRLHLRARRNATAFLLADPSGHAYPGGLHGQQVTAQRYYPRRRRKRLRDTILFENWKGKQYSDSLAAVDLELRRRGDPRERVWVVRSHAVRVPPGTRTVLRFSREYYDLLARSRWLIANDAIDGSFVKRDDAVYLQTWHGTPLKKVGFDIERVNFANKMYLEGFALEVAKWDYLVSPNPYSSEILRRAFRFDGPLLETGYPRNDVFYRPEREQRAKAVRERLGLSPQQRVILYAPTWRDDRYDQQGRYLFDLKLNMDLLRDRLQDDHVLLLRGHHLLANRAASDPGGGFVLNVSTYPDIADLYLIADVLITDYSSVMFDFANTGRPMIFYTWDLDDYRDRLRGMYFDLTEDPPGPVCRTSAEVLDALTSLPDLQQQYDDPLRRFRDRFCGWEDGQASARVVDAVFG